MSRKKKEYRKNDVSDAKYGDSVVGKFINSMMWHGKKSKAEKVFYDALDTIKQRVDKDGIDVFKEAMDNVRPAVEVRSRRVGGATYQVPTEVRQVRRDTLAIRWLINNARSRNEKGMKDRLANEFIDASQNRGSAVKKKEDTHKMADANRAFAHFRW